MTPQHPAPKRRRSKVRGKHGEALAAPEGKTGQRKTDLGKPGRRKLGQRKLGRGGGKPGLPGKPAPHGTSASGGRTGVATTASRDQASAHVGRVERVAAVAAGAREATSVEGVQPHATRGRVRRHRGKREEVFHGVRACAALFARRPEAIVRVYLTPGRRREFAPLLDWCAREHKGFQVVPEENLARLAGSLHHEGVAILARALPRGTGCDLLAGIAAGTIVGPLIYLDGVQNPHNLGSILRTAAHFGAGAVVGGTGQLPALSAAAARVAEGAAESVPVFDCIDPLADLRRLRDAGFVTVVAASSGGESLFTAAFDRRVVIVLGNEAEGVSRRLLAAADRIVRIPGTGVVESLNVSVACGVVLAEVWRRGSHRKPGPGDAS